MHLVVDQVIELQHVHVAHRDRTFELLAGAAVVQRGLTGCRQVGQRKQILDLLLAGTVEYRRRHRHTLL